MKNIYIIRKQEKSACTLPSDCDSKTVEMCKENLSKIVTL